MPSSPKPNTLRPRVPCQAKVASNAMRPPVEMQRRQRRQGVRCSFEAKGAARRPVGRPDVGAPRCMDRSSPAVAAAFHGCRSGTAFDRASPSACSSSAAGVWRSVVDTLASRRGCRTSLRRPPFVVDLSNDRGATDVDSACGQGGRRPVRAPRWGSLPSPRLMRQPQAKGAARFGYGGGGLALLWSYRVTRGGGRVHAGATPPRSWVKVRHVRTNA